MTNKSQHTQRFSDLSSVESVGRTFACFQQTLSLIQILHN